jgi:hypothetical protein
MSMLRKMVIVTLKKKSNDALKRSIDFRSSS